MPEDSAVLGFDFGMKRIGVAVGQTLLGHANPLSTLQAKQGSPDWSRIKSLIQEWNATALIVGIPLNIDGTEQHTTHAARHFANQLEQHFGLPVHRVDERLSTVDARQRIFEEGGYRALQKAEVDSIAAKIIIEHWFSIMKGN